MSRRLYLIASRTLFCLFSIARFLLVHKLMSPVISAPYISGIHTVQSGTLKQMSYLKLVPQNFFLLLRKNKRKKAAFIINWYDNWFRVCVCCWWALQQIDWRHKCISTAAAFYWATLFYVDILSCKSPSLAAILSWI